MSMTEPPSHVAPDEDDEDANEHNEPLLQAAKAGNVTQIRELLDAGADAFYQETEKGSSVLMHAAASGSVEAVQTLLQAGAPWNALDRYGRCAGEYAIDAGHQNIIDVLVNHAVVAEQLLGYLERKSLDAERKTKGGNLDDSAEYLGRNVRYEGDKLLDQADDGVMMEWERPLMEAHAKVLCGTDRDKDVLNVGFGMGIIDGCIQELGCKSHTIIEAHPDVHRKMLEDGWDKKPGVRIAFGRWQDVIKGLGPFDSIFYDTYAEHFTDMQEFHDLVPQILRPGGTYSFFNGLCPNNVFFHGVACQGVQLELERLQFEVEFRTVDIDVDEKTWEGVRRKYWHDRKEYYLPVAVYYPEEEESQDEAASGDEADLMAAPSGQV
uniref:Protein arginine N-methyltransferase 2 n=1 Tax=Eutreptiella gymnastica TaxID=73025 RepID=A0A7S1IDL9_9EUGL